MKSFYSTRVFLCAVTVCVDKIEQQNDGESEASLFTRNCLAEKKIKKIKRSKKSFFSREVNFIIIIITAYLHRRITMDHMIYIF